MDNNHIRPYLKGFFDVLVERKIPHIKTKKLKKFAKHVLHKTLHTTTQVATRNITVSVYAIAMIYYCVSSFSKLTVTWAQENLDRSTIISYSIGGY